MNRILIALVLALGLLLPAGRVLAASTNAPNAQTIALACTTPTGMMDFVVVVNTGQAGQHGQMTAIPLTPGFIVSGGTGKIIPTSLSFSAPGGPVIETVTKGNAQGPAAGIPVTCTFSLFGGTGAVTGYWLS